MTWKYDVVVVGSGIAGPIVARNVAKAGFSVLLIDKKWAIGTPKQCAEGISIKVFDKYDIPPYDKRFINREIYGAKLYSPPSGYELEMRYKEVSGVILERKSSTRCWLITRLKQVQRFSRGPRRSMS